MEMPKPYKLIFVLVSVVVLLFLFFVVFGEDLEKSKELREKLKAQEETNNAIQEKLDSTRVKLANMQNPEYLEHLAREQGLAYPDDVVYIYEDTSKEENK